MNPPRILRAAALCLLGFSAALVPAPLFAAGAPTPIRPPAPRGPDPEFWSVRFNTPEKFDNRGIPSYRHATMTSKKLRFAGEAETEVGYTVYLPPGYEGSDERYAILYFLVGNGGTENGSVPVVTKAHELIVKGEIPPFIIVGITGGRSFYGNQFEGKCQMQDFFFEEFLPHIEKNYRVKADPRHRHIQGMSAGGNGAVVYALQRPDLFGTATAIAGAFFGIRVHAWTEMYNASENNYRPYDPFALIAERPPRSGTLRLALWVGSADGTIGDATQFHRLLSELSIAHEYNDWNSRPALVGVPHSLPRYYELYGKEILEFHAAAFRD
ncbi:MAG: alpha/beta hydrolase-fold protein [Opitutaceae bacterium]